MRIVKKIILILLLVIVIFTIVGSVVLLNPGWFSPLLEKTLASRGFKTEIGQLSSRFDTKHYYVEGVFSTQSNRLGINAHRVQINGTINWSDIFSEQPLLSRLVVTDANINIDREQLTEQLQPNQHPTPSARGDFSRYIPQSWQIKNAAIRTQKQQFYLSGQGKALQQIHFSLTDNHSGTLTASYRADKQQLSVHSKALNLAPITGYDALLENLSAEINTRDWLNSQLLTELDYRGTRRHIQITAEDNQRLRITAGDDNQRLSMTAEAIDDNRAALIRFDDMDLSALELVEPLLPDTVRMYLPRLSGFISGSVTVDREGGIDDTQIALRDVSIAHQQLNVTHVSGQIDYRHQQQLNYHLTLSDSDLLLPAIFYQTIPKLHGTLQGAYNRQTKQIDVVNLAIRNDDIEQLKLIGQIDLDKAFIDIKGSGRGVNLSATPRYLPKQLSQKTAKWLAGALVSGKDNRVTVVIHGKLRELLTSAKSTMAIDVVLHDGRFRYLKNNPEIDIQKAKVAIKGKSLSVDLTKGSLKGVPLRGKAHIDDMSATTVEVEAKLARYAVKKLLAIAQKSIARKTIKAVNNILQADGQAAVELKLYLPIADKNLKNTFDIVLKTDKSNIKLRRYPHLPIKHQQALIKINEKGLLSVTGKNEKRPWEKVNISRDAKQRYLIDVTYSKPLLPTLQQLNFLSSHQVRQLEKYRLVAGNALFRVHLVLDKDGQLKTVNVTSDLVGVSLNIFGALVKGKKTVLPMTLSYTANTGRFNVNLKKRLQLEFSVNQSGQLQGLLLDNRQFRRSYRKGVVQMYWRSKRLEGEALRRFYRDFFANQKSKSKLKSGLRPQVDIAIDEVVLEEDYHVPFKAKGTLKKLSLSGGLFSGKVHYRNNYLSAQLKKADISELLHLLEKPSVNPAGRKVVAFDLASNLPQMDITIDNVLFKGSNVGSATIHTSIRKGRYSIDDILLNGKDYYLTLSGYEAQEPQGITTHIQADFKGERIQNVVKAFRLNPIMTGKFLDISANLSWPGRAHTLNLQKSYGRASIKAQNVKLVNISSGVGSVFGLMDIVGILNRVSMDFQNLTTSKISFDSIDGSWNIGGGRAVSRNTVATGSTIDLKINGAIDLYRQTFDHLRMLVIPKASNVMPVIGAVAGGVVGGAVGFIVKQIIGDSVNEAIGVPYILSGSWSEPELLSKADRDKRKKRQKSKPKVAPPVIILESLQ
ncbi:MAG: hypothetical protein CSA44_02610 [Gammaproteobacteria bacterium]|nr:MAG: hypothetical protein CSA44_02610 [Gammaproteobacteria bacterium]